MATIERVKPVDRSRVAGYVLIGVVGFAAIALAVHYFTRPPQMGTDDDVFKTVDALYTAIRMKDTGKLAQCEQRLHAQREAGKLPSGPAEYLDGVIAKARGGDWDSAVERLYEFMSAQRREGRTTALEEKPMKKPARK